MPLTGSPQTLETANKLVSTLRGAFGTPDAYRPAHAKGHIVKGTFTSTSEAATLSKAPHFAATVTPVLVRFSSSSGLPNIPDTSPNASPRGLAIRFLLSEDGHHHTDIVAHSTPHFPSRTGEDFLSFLEAIRNNTIVEYLEKSPAAAAFVSAPKPHPTSFATEKFFGVHAFRFVNDDGQEAFIRYRIVPENYAILSEGELESKNDSYLFEDLESRLARDPVKFLLRAQIAHVGDITDDATIRWPEDRVVVTLGSLTLESYVAQDESLREQQSVIFDPVPRVEGIEASDDPLLHMRAAIYLISGRVRRQAGANRG